MFEEGSQLYLVIFLNKKISGSPQRKYQYSNIFANSKILGNA